MGSGICLCIPNTNLEPLRVDSGDVFLGKSIQAIWNFDRWYPPLGSSAKLLALSPAMALPHPCRAYSPAPALRTGKACAPRCSGLSGHHPSPQGLAPSVRASRLPRLQRLIRAPRCTPPWAFRGSGHVLPQGPRPLGHLPQQHLSCPGVSEVVAPLSLRRPHLRSSGLFQEGGAAAMVRTQQKRRGAAPRGCPAKGRPQTWVTCGDGQGARAFAFRTKIARAAGRRSCGALPPS